MTYRTRRRLSILILVIGLPAYVVVATTLVGLIDRPGMLAELAIYVGLGVLWALPLRRLVRGIARPDPERAPPPPPLSPGNSPGSGRRRPGPW